MLWNVLQQIMLSAEVLLQCSYSNYWTLQREGSMQSTDVNGLEFQSPDMNVSKSSCSATASKLI